MATIAEGRDSVPRTGGPGAIKASPAEQSEAIRRDPAWALDRHAGDIDRCLGQTARRLRLSRGDDDDFRGWAFLKLVEDDYRRIRRYDGRSAFSTYLTTVIARLGLDYADHLWGRWRPCSLARRSGAVGVRLDQLIHCDGHTVRDAVELVVRNEAEGRSREELDRLGGQIQRLQRPRWVSLEAARDVASDEEPRFERGAQRAVAVSLWRLLGKLEPTDRELLLQRFVEELPARDVARKLGRSPSEVYRRTAVLLRRLRRELEPMLRLEAGRLSLQERRDRNEIASSRVRLQPTAG